MDALATEAEEGAQQGNMKDLYTITKKFWKVLQTQEASEKQKWKSHSR